VALQLLVQGCKPVSGTRVMITVALTASLAGAPSVEAVEIPHAKGHELRREAVACRRLETILRRLVAARDPAEFARQHGLTYRNGAVRVILELSRPDAHLPEGYVIHIEGRDGAVVQAHVAIPDLCLIADEPQVRSVRVAAAPTPLRGQ
jgi:hypothetical protein